MFDPELESFKTSIDLRAYPMPRTYVHQPGGRAESETAFEMPSGCMPCLWKNRLSVKKPARLHLRGCVKIRPFAFVNYSLGVFI